MGTQSTAPSSITTPNSGRLGSLLRVPVDYVLEIYEGHLAEYSTLVRAVTLPNTPKEYEQKRPSATILTHTLNDVVREHTENHMTHITVRGVSGYTARLGHTRDGGVSSLLGPKILSEFDLFLDEYQTKVAKEGSLNVYMVFRALNEGVALRVEPMNWQWRESADSARFSYEWTLELEAYAPAPPNPLVDILSPLTEALRSAQDQINRVAGYVELAATAVGNTRGELTEVTNTLRSVGRVATALQNVIGEVDNVRTFLTDTLPATLVLEAGRFKQAYDDAIELRDETFADPLGLYDDLYRSAHAVVYGALCSAGLLRVQKEALAAQPSTTEHSTVGAITRSVPRSRTQHIWRAGDTLQSVAQRAYGDTSRWVEIAKFNGMKTPRHWGDGTPLVVGDVLAVPRDGEIDTRGSISIDPFAVDIAVDMSTMDIRFTEDNDVMLKKGRQNLEQALALRLLTEQGDSYLFPAYGLPVRIGGTNNAREVAYIASHVRDQLTRDARVRDVRDVNVLIEGDTVAVAVSLFPITGDAIDLVTPYIREV